MSNWWPILARPPPTLKANNATTGEPSNETTNPNVRRYFSCWRRFDDADPVPLHPHTCHWKRNGARISNQRRWCNGGGQL